MIGSILAKNSFQDFGIGLGLIISKRQQNKVYISFRGHECDKEFNCEVLASIFQGGGHKMASGCMISQECYEKHFHIVRSVKLNFKD